MKTKHERKKKLNMPLGKIAFHCDTQHQFLELKMSTIFWFVGLIQLTTDHRCVIMIDTQWFSSWFNAFLDFFQLKLFFLKISVLFFVKRKFEIDLKKSIHLKRINFFVFKKIVVFLVFFSIKCLTFNVWTWISSIFERFLLLSVVFLPKLLEFSFKKFDFIYRCA